MFQNKLAKKILIASLIAGFLPLAAFAAGILPAECLAQGNCGLNQILQTAVNVANWILGSVGAIALLFFVYGGFVFILSGGSEERVKLGKQILINSIIGLAIVIASYLIIQFSAGLLGAKVNPGLQINIPKSQT